MTIKQARTSFVLELPPGCSYPAEHPAHPTGCLHSPVGHLRTSPFPFLHTPLSGVGGAFCCPPPPQLSCCHWGCAPGTDLSGQPSPFKLNSVPPYFSQETRGFQSEYLFTLVDLCAYQLLKDCLGVEDNPNSDSDGQKWAWWEEFRYQREGTLFIPQPGHLPPPVSQRKRIP